jgi:hypothetical protein
MQAMRAQAGGGCAARAAACSMLQAPSKNTLAIGTRGAPLAARARMAYALTVSVCHTHAVLPLQVVIIAGIIGVSTILISVGSPVLQNVVNSFPRTE